VSNEFFSLFNAFMFGFFYEYLICPTLENWLIFSLGELHWMRSRTHFAPEWLPKLKIHLTENSEYFNFILSRNAKTVSLPSRFPLNTPALTECTYVCTLYSSFILFVIIDQQGKEASWFKAWTSIIRWTYTCRRMGTF